MQYHFWVVLCLFTAVASPSSAQTVNETERSRYGAASYYNYAESADVTMLVNVWGTVRNPGLYEIPQETTLNHLLSLSGGPIVAQRAQRQDRVIQVRLFRQNSDGREVIFETAMENEVVASANDPILREGDIVTIETVVRQRFSWRDAFPIIAAVGTIAIAIERLAN